MIKFIDVTIGQAEQLCLERCSLEIRRGEVISLVGPTGSGKSSALSAVAGRRKIRHGQILWDGRDMGRSPKKLAVRCGYASDIVKGPSDLNGLDWTHFWLELSGLNLKERDKRVTRACKTFQVASSGVRMDALSRGERRLWDLVRLWAGPHDVLVMDTVSGDLDGHGLTRLTGAVKDAAAEGRTIVLSENTPHLAVAVSDRVLALKAGAVVSEINRSDAHFQSLVASAQGWAD